MDGQRDRRDHRREWNRVGAVRPAVQAVRPTRSTRLRAIFPTSPGRRRRWRLGGDGAAATREQRRARRGKAAQAERPAHRAHQRRLVEPGLRLWSGPRRAGGYPAVRLPARPMATPRRRAAWAARRAPAPPLTTPRAPARPRSTSPAALAAVHAGRAGAGGNATWTAAATSPPCRRFGGRLRHGQGRRWRLRQAPSAIPAAWPGRLRPAGGISGFHEPRSGLSLGQKATAMPAAAATGCRGGRRPPTPRSPSIRPASPSTPNTSAPRHSAKGQGDDVLAGQRGAATCWRPATSPAAKTSTPPRSAMAAPAAAPNKATVVGGTGAPPTSARRPSPPAPASASAGAVAKAGASGNGYDGARRRRRRGRAAQERGRRLDRWRPAEPDPECLRGATAAFPPPSRAASAVTARPNWPSTISPTPLKAPLSASHRHRPRRIRRKVRGRDRRRGRRRSQGQDKDDRRRSGGRHRQGVRWPRRRHDLRRLGRWRGWRLRWQRVHRYRLVRAGHGQRHRRRRWRRPGAGGERRRWRDGRGDGRHPLFLGKRPRRGLCPRHRGPRGHRLQRRRRRGRGGEQPHRGGHGLHQQRLSGAAPVCSRRRRRRFARRDARDRWRGLHRHDPQRCFERHPKRLPARPPLRLRRQRRERLRRRQRRRRRAPAWRR